MSTETEVLVPPQNGAEPGDRPGRGAAMRWLRWAAATPEVGVIVLCVLVFVAIALKTGDYAHTGNLQVMGRDLAQVGILAIGESMVILTGGIDLSVGALAGFAGVLVAWWNVRDGIPAGLAILLVLLTCGLIGLWHGLMVTRLKVPPFVITLVTYTVTIGAGLAMTTGYPVNGISPVFSDLEQYYIGQIPVAVLFFLGAAVVAWFFLERTYVGRQVYAVGGNREAARLAGIRTERRIVAMYMTSSVLAGLVGVLVIGRMNVADPSVSSSGWELQAIAAAVIGGVSLFGGEGRILGIAAGAILLEFISNGLIALRVSSYWTNVIEGGVLGVAIILDRLRARYFGGGTRQ